MGENFRVFPISNWTEMDVWQYILQENIAIPELYFAKERNVIWRNGSWLPVSEHITLRDGDEPQMKMVRFRTLGDITITGGQESDADTLEKIVQEVASSRQTERGNREDDKRSESAMEDRKRQGYFEFSNTKKIQWKTISIHKVIWIWSCFASLPRVV